MEHSTAGNKTEGAIFYVWLKRLVKAEPQELKALLWSFCYFFSLLSGYYVIRPLRETMGIAGGVENLQWLFTGTFLAMLAAVPIFGWVTSRYRRKQFLPYVYYFFIANLLLFFLLFKSNITHAYVARAFFIWTSVFNLFVISVFWSFMADIYSNAQAKRLFGFIAAGGTAGALTGPALTVTLVGPLGPTNLLLISALFLALAVYCIHKLIIWRERLQVADQSNIKNASIAEDRAMGGGIFTGIRLLFGSWYLIGICLLILLYTTLATFLYFQQAYIIRDNFPNPADQTSVFAMIDFSANALTVLLQVFFTSRIVKAFGMGWTLALVPLCLGVGLLILGLMPVLGVLIVIQVLRRAGNYAIMRPAREMLFVVLGKQEKYKAKNVIDTAVYRGGDAVSAWVYKGLQAVGLELSSIAFVAVPLAGVWALLAYRLGKQQEVLANRVGFERR